MASSSSWIQVNEGPTTYQQLYHLAEQHDQFLAYGTGKDWTVMPYQKCNNLLSRKYQQILNILKLATGIHTTVTKASSCATTTNKVQAVVQRRCPFCTPQVTQSQSVLEGKTVRVLYNYAPMGIGQEKLHFLMIPKAHKPGFRDLTEEEYLEAISLKDRVISMLSKKRTIYKTYLLHKTGVDAGQTVPHWHLHLIVTTNCTNDLLTKVVFFFQQFVKPRKLSPTTLQAAVTKFRSDLKE